MSKCTMSITVDGWQAMGDVAPTYAIGTAVTGTIDVWVSDRVTCDGLDLWLEAEPVSMGYAGGLAGERVRVFEGRWEPGEYRYRFSLPSLWLPSFKRHHVGWVWNVQAAADIPWAIDPTAASSVVLAWARPPDSLEVETLQPAPGRGGVLGAVADLVGLGAGSQGAVTAEGIEHIEVTIPPARGGYRAADEAGLLCRVTPSEPLSAGTARLVVEEYAEWTRTRNEHTTTYREHHPYHQHTVPLRLDSSRGDWVASLPLPDPAAVPWFSHGGRVGRGVIWRVEIASQRQGRPHSDESLRYLRVRPRLRDETQSI